MSDPPGHPAASLVSAEVRGLPSGGCSAAVRLELWGNPQGDPALPAVELGVLANAARNCDDGRFVDAGVVLDGRTTLGLCAQPVARGVRAHDLTGFVLSVGGRAVPVASGTGGGAVSRGNELPEAGPRQPDLRGLPFTGSWTALLLGWGLLALGAGAVLARAGRRLHSGNGPTTPANQRFW